MTSRHYALISLSVLSLALAVGCPSWAFAKEKASTAKSESVSKSETTKKSATGKKSATKTDSEDAPDKDKTKGKLAVKDKPAKKTAGKSKTIAASDEDDAPPSKSKSKTTKSDTSRLSSRDDAPDKKKTGAKKVTTSDADEDTPTSKDKAAKGKTAKASTSAKTTKLARADSDAPNSDAPKKNAHTGRINKKTDKPATSEDDADSLTKVLAGNKAKPLKLKDRKALSKADLRLAEAASKNADKLSVKLSIIKPVVTEAPGAVAMPVLMNAAPVPYRMVAPQAPKPAQIALNTVLSADDTTHYQTAFTLIDQGDFEGARTELALVNNKNLMGYAEFHMLFASGYESSYDELIDWMAKYGDQPMAMRVWALAKRKKPEGAPDPAFPLLNGTPELMARTNSGNAVQMTATTRLINSHSGDDEDTDDTGYATMPMLDPNDSDLTPKSARSAYNNGQMEQAVKLGRKIGDHWVAGLACWRLQRYDQALAEFKFVSTDPSRNAWSQSGGAYWAARAAQKLGHPDEAQTYLKIAASFPFTFYGLLAEARLGVTPAVVLAKKGLPPTFSNEQRTALTASLDGDFNWTKSNVQAQRLNALVQIGRASDAQNEIQSAVQRTSNGVERDRWLALAAKMQVSVNQLQPNDRLFDPNIYPIPDFEPSEGYSVDKALLFAFARKESKFDPKARSYSGAYGLLQLMPSTAALVEDDPSFNKKPEKLLKPAVNLRVGQKYIQRLFDSKIVSNDLLRTIAAYNAGPRPVKDALDSLGPQADSLLVMESIPVAQTRQYVEEVAANYWIYRQILDNSSKTLAMAANDAAIIDATADSN